MSSCDGSKQGTHLTLNEVLEILKESSSGCERTMNFLTKLKTKGYLLEVELERRVRVVLQTKYRMDERVVVDLMNKKIFEAYDLHEYFKDDPNVNPTDIIEMAEDIAATIEQYENQNDDTED